MSRARMPAVIALAVGCVAVLPAMLCAAGCGGAEERAGRDAADARASGDLASLHGRAAAAPLRIASLSPALTQCIVELGAADVIVGRTPWCEGAARDAPVVGTLLDIDAEALVRCSPTCIIVQPPAQGMDPGVAALAQARGWALHAWRIDGIDDAGLAMRELAELVAAQLPSRAEAVRASAARWARDLESATAPLPRKDGAAAPRVLVVVGGAEGVAFGSGTYVSDALSRMGCANALTQGGYPALAAEDAVRLRPDIAVVVGTSAPSESLRSALEAAVPSMRVERIGGGDLLVPGGGLPRGLAELRRAVAHASSAHRQDAQGREDSDHDGR